MSTQDGKQLSVLQPPTTCDPEAWKSYWKILGQPWRTEPEIDSKRQEELAQRRPIIPDIEKGIYPFKGVKLSRADVEWLLATHESGGSRGPVDWSDESQRTREGIDLCGADLSYLDLRHLPLARLRGGLSLDQHPSKEERNKAAILLKGADLRYAHLEGANLYWADLRDADLWRARVEEASLNRARLQGAYLIEAHLEHTDLSRAQLEGVQLENVLWSDEQGIGPLLADAQWGNTNLAVLQWSQLKMLGDEHIARQQQTIEGKRKDRDLRLKAYAIAVRANRQLAVALQGQGLNEDAARFAYRAQKLQCVVSCLQRKFGQYLFSVFLDVLAGYGYRPERSLFWYLTTIFGFALAYFAFGHLPILPDAFVFSLASFHGRGFFPGLGVSASLHSPLVVLAAIEAVVGLLIEISFIATFTQRFFGR